MADIKKYLDYEGLQQYTVKVKALVDDANDNMLDAAKAYTDEKIGTLETGVTTVAAAIAGEKSLREAADTAINTKIGTVPEKVGEITTSNVIAYVDAKIASELASIEGVMHFIGAYDSFDAIAADTTYTPAEGDVVLIGTKEYVYNSSNEWKEFGDESLYVSKTTTIAGIDLQDNITADELKVALGVDTTYTAITTAEIDDMFSALNDEETAV